MKTRRRKKEEEPVREESFTVVEIDDFETVCRVCDAEFLDELDLKLHVAQVHLNELDGKPICKVCYNTFASAEELVSHFINKHLETSVFCFYCYRAFANPEHLEQHELKHCAVAMDSDVTCSHCASIFDSRQLLQNHEYSEHRNDKDGFMLNSYFSILSSALNVKIMKFLDCLCKKEPIVCSNCHHSSSNIKNYIKHLKISKCQSFACDKCFNVYKKKNSIAIHMQKKPQCHNFVMQKALKKPCDKCEKYFDVKDLIVHKESCNVLRCSACMKLFNSMSELTDHRVQKHQISISLQTCKFCKKEFVGTLNLKKHMNRSHKNKRLYKYNCVYCGLMFIHPKKLFAHFFTQHKLIEPYTCQICNKCFRLRKHFTIHIKLEHNSNGFVEFDKNLHVIFTNKKSKNPINPQANINMDSTTDFSDSDYNNTSKEKNGINGIEEKSKCKESPANPKKIVGDNIQSTVSPGKTIEFDEMNLLKVRNDLSRPFDTIKIEFEQLNPKVRRKRKRKTVKNVPKKRKILGNPEQMSSNNSEEEPLSNIKESLLENTTREFRNLPKHKRRMTIRDKRTKLTCQRCNKYCYTVQNYHHHLTLHEQTKLKRCIKCQQYFKSSKELENHIDSSHSSSKLIETLKSVLEKRKKIQPTQKPGSRPGEHLKSLLEKRKMAQKLMAQNSTTNKFRRTIKKVLINDDCTASITPISDHGLSVKNFIENFKPEGDNLNICNSVTIKPINEPVEREPFIKLHKFNPEPPPDSCIKLKLPVKFNDSYSDYIESKVNVNLVQQLITKPKAVNIDIDERVPLIEEKIESQYCNMIADDTDYTQYKNDVIPEVAHEVMLGDLEDIPRTRRLAQEIIIPKIPKQYGEVRIGHLLPQAPYYKIVKVNKLLESTKNSVADAAKATTGRAVKLPDGTRLISVKNPYAHLIANEDLEEVLKANKNKYYTPKTKNIKKALAKALGQITPPKEKKTKKRAKTKS